MDYKTLKQNLMNTFQQLVIFELRETKLCEVKQLMNTAVVHDLTCGNDMYPKKYYVGTYDFKPIIIILEDFLSQGDAYKDYITIIYNIYCAIVKKSKGMMHYDEIFELTKGLTDSDKTINWIWFREKNYCLPDKIITRARSWIELNPEYTFNLWTNLTDKNELNEFISALNDEHKKYFTEGKIVIKYQEQTFSVVQAFYEKYHSRLNEGAESVFKTLFEKCEQQQHIGNYKINRIFKTDMLRVILLNMLGGIYSDFNDTICFFPMKYLLTLYKDEYFVGSDHDIEHPIFRNNYFMYNSMKDNEYVDLSLKLINKATIQYLELNSLEHFKKYFDVCLEFVSMVNQQRPTMSDICLIPIYMQSGALKNILDNDKKKDPNRILSFIIELLVYFSNEITQLVPICDKLKIEAENIDKNQLNFGQVKQRRNRRRRNNRITQVFEVNYPIMFDLDKIEKMTNTYDYRDYFLIKYACFMTNGDLITSTNFAYISEIKNLIPFCRSNRLSTISMITHIYDGTSYGLNKNYEMVSEQADDLRRNFL